MDSEIKASKKDYEISILLKTTEALSGVLGVLRKHNAETYFESPVNQIKLAYQIKKQPSAFFGYMCFRALPEEVIKIKNELDLEPALLRLLIITPPIKAPSREPRQAPRPQETKPAPEAVILSNEALEQKLEEILK